MKKVSITISTALIGCGAVMLAFTARPILGDTSSIPPLNPLGIKKSPYGEVFAMAMQGPIDRHWHGTVDTNTHRDCDNYSNCSHPFHQEKPEAAPAAEPSWKQSIIAHLDGMKLALEERTNPKAASETHKLFIRRGIEDKLRFAYELDPAHYANYNTYHFFLTEPQLGTRPQLNSSAAKLAQDTINYCLAQRTDPRHALTAAAAAGNVVELMLNDRHSNPEKPNYTAEQMREVISIMDQSIGLYSHLANEWEENGTWNELSEMRLLEVADRLHFTMKIREAHDAAIRRLEGLPPQQSAGTDNSNELN